MPGLNGITSVFWQNYSQTNEQNLLQDLFDESIAIYGQDVVYIPRNLQNFDQIYLTDDSSTYSTTYDICMYIENFEQWLGEGDLAMKLGMKISRKIIWTVSRRVFQDEIGTPNDNVGTTTEIKRPREGDLIYYPLSGQVFQISYVDPYEMFFQLGALQTWRLTTELFEYAGETFNTGIPNVDRLQLSFSTNILDWSILTEDGFNLTTETGNYIVVDQFDINKIDPLADNDEIKTEDEGYLNLSEINPFSERADGLAP